MPLAGWCRECGEWVWVDSEGACQHGHGPEHVESIHEQADPTEERPAAWGKAPNTAGDQSDRPFGVGELPRELYRFNWGAFFVPFFWGIIYRSWPVLMAWFIGVSSPLVLFSIFGIVDKVPPIASLVGATVLAEIVSGLSRIWAGTVATGSLWKREAIRLEYLTSSQPRFSAEHFAMRQRQWGWWGAGLLAVGAFASIPIGAATWKPYGLMYVGSVMPLMWLAAEVMLALWLDTRMRQQGPDTGERAQDLA